MYTFGEKHPVIFEFLLIFAAFLAAGVLTAAGSILNLHSALSTSLARIAVGLALYLLFKRAFPGVNPLKGFVYVVPAFLFAVWNLCYNLSSGMEFGGSAYFIEAAVTALAPAVFEEVIFRGIFLYNLRRKGHGDMACLFISAVVFAVIHLTNAVGQDLTTVVLQVGYSFVVGLVFAAIYLKNGSLLQVMLAHFLIDFTNRLYVEEATSASNLHIAIFVVLLAAEAVYAVLLTRRPAPQEEQRS